MAKKNIFACKKGEVEVGRPTMVRVGKYSIGLYRTPDGFHALLNVCPHRGAPLCEGLVCGTTKHTDGREFVYHRENEIVRCAWHGWEFDIRTGASLVDPKIRARTFDVVVEGDDLFVQV
jgi:nitrite reductase (NADH) small subunit